MNDYEIFVSRKNMSWLAVSVDGTLVQIADKNSNVHNGYRESDVDLRFGSFTVADNGDVSAHGATARSKRRRRVSRMIPANTRRFSPRVKAWTPTATALTKPSEWMRYSALVCSLLIRTTPILFSWARRITVCCAA